MADYDKAYRRFAERIEDPAVEVTFNLKPDELLIVNNTRVPHARKSLSGMGKRWLRGTVLAEKEGAPEDLIAAALLHDTGHYTSEFGAMSLGDERGNCHEEPGAHVLGPFFPHVITECVLLHVLAKRYLCAPDKGCCDRLSEESKHTLMLQGGPRSLHEVREFEKNPFHKEAVKVRIRDAEGKNPGMKTPDFRSYVPLLKRVVERQEGRAG